jgi:hypothetical protein
MKGAVVFIIAFLIFLAVTLFVIKEFPPGNIISDTFGIDPTYEWPENSGFLIRTLASAILNGVIYGVIIWFIFSIIEKTRERKPPSTSAD